MAGLWTRLYGTLTTVVPGSRVDRRRKCTLARPWTARCHDGGVPIRVFLLDDHELVREGVRSLLESDEGIAVVGEASTRAEALARIPLAKPDVAILDVRLEDGSGIEVCRDVRSIMPEMACLILTSFADDEALYASVMAGASGYVLKQIRARDLIEDVKKVAGGASLMDPRAVAQVVERIANPPQSDPAIETRVWLQLPLSWSLHVRCELESHLATDADRVVQEHEPNDRLYRQHRDLD